MSRYLLGCDVLGGTVYRPPPNAIVRRPTEAIVQSVGVTYDAAVKEAEKVKSVVSPWLWIFAVTGFVLGIWDKYQINAMYGSHKKMRQTLRLTPHDGDRG